MIPHLYVDSGFNLTDSVPLSPPQHHYLSRVMRLKPGNLVHVFNGAQGLWQAHMGGTELIDLLPLVPQPEKPQARCLFFSPIKMQNWLIEKATELGITDFFPILCQRTVVRHFCHKRHMKIIHEACEQSHRLTIPHLHLLKPLGQYLDDARIAKDYGPLAVLTLDAGTAMQQAVPAPKGVFIGPEGGWSPEEIERFQACPHIAGVHLGCAVLRAETAAVVAGTLMHYGYTQAPPPNPL